MPKVNSNILIWARESAGLMKDHAAKRLGFKDGKKRTGVERLEGLEAGEEEPSRSVLIRMSKQYHRPLLTFYLSAPPRSGSRGQDFRTLPDAPLATNEALLDALIRDVQVRQGLIRSVLLDEDEDYHLGFVGSKNVTDGVDELLQSIASQLSLNLELFRAQKTPNEAFQVLREHCESLGIFVVLIGNLGSYHTDLSAATFRGFALADKVAPFIIINDNDSRAAWSFTLLHEMVHIWLGQTGVSGGTPSIEIEQFCNDVASEFLLPASGLSELQSISGLPWEHILSIIDDFSKTRNVSRSMVSYKLLRCGYISNHTWQKLAGHYKDVWEQYLVDKRGKTRSSDNSGGPNYYTIRRHRLGSALVHTTARLLSSGLLTTSKAGQVLGVRPKNVERVVSNAQAT